MRDFQTRQERTKSISFLRLRLSKSDGGQLLVVDGNLISNHCELLCILIRVALRSTKFNSDNPTTCLLTLSHELEGDKGLERRALKLTYPNVKLNVTEPTAELISLLETLHNEKVIMPILLGITQEHVAAAFFSGFYHHGSCSKIARWIYQGV